MQVCDRHGSGWRQSLSGRSTSILIVALDNLPDSDADVAAVLAPACSPGRTKAADTRAAAGAASLSIPALRVGDPYPPRKRRALRNTPNFRRSSFAFKITPGKRVPTAFQPIREHKHEHEP